MNEGWMSGKEREGEGIPWVEGYMYMKGVSFCLYHTSYSCDHLL